MEYKRFSPFEAIVFGLRMFMEKLRLFALTWGIATGATIIVVAVIGLMNMSFFKEAGMMLHGHMQAGSFSSDAPLGTGMAIARELLCKACEYKVMLGLSIVAFAIFVSGISAGYTGMYLEVRDTGTSKPTHIFGFFKYAFTVFLASIVAWVGILAGLTLFVLPGIYLALRWSLFAFFIVDRDAGCLESLRMSWQATRGQVWSLLALAVVQLLLVKLGFIGMFLGFITGLAYTYTYRTLVPKNAL